MIMTGQHQPFDNNTSLNERLDVSFALQAAGLGVWELDPVTNLVNWDDRCRELFGLAKDNVLTYEQAMSYIHPDDVGRVDEAIQWAMNPASGGHYDITYRTIGADDEKLRWVRFTGRGYFAQDGRIQRFAGVAQDVTSDSQKDHALNQAQQRFQAAFDNSSLGLIITTPDSQFQIVNKAFSVLTGYTVGELINTTYTNLTHPDDISRNQALVEQLNRGEINFFNLDKRYVRKDGSLIWVRMHVSRIARDDGQTDSLIGICQDITAEIAAHQALQESEARFRSLVADAPVATCLFMGRDMIVAIANEPMLAFWGKGRTVFGKPLAEAVPELNGQPFLHILDEVFTTGKRYEARSARAELEVDSVRGTYYFDFTYEPLRNAAGEVYAIMDMAIDVTQQVLSRKAIEASEARLHSIIASAPAAMSLFVGRDLMVELPNQAFIDIVGKGPDIVGKPLREVMPELISEDQPFLKILDDVYTSGKTFQTFGSQVKIVQHGVMTDNYYNFTYSPLFDADGQVYAILDIAIDVTEQIKARQKLEASEAFSRNLVYSSPVANLVLVGEQMVIQTVNEGMLTMLGRDEGIIGQPFMKAMPELRPTPLMDRLQHVLTTGETFHQPEERVNLIRYGQPYTGYYHYIYTALKDELSLPIGVVVTAIEVTSQVLARQKVEDSEARYRTLSEELESRVQQRTQELLLANQDLKRSNDNLQQFAYVASHDLQEPLRKIQSFSSLLNDQYGDQLGESGRDFLGRMAAAGERMSTLIKDLLTYSRISTRQQVFGQVSLEAIVAGVLNTLEWDIEQRQAQISVAPLPLVRGDQSQLNQLFQNLISNGLKFTPAGQIPQIQITSNECDRSQLPKEVRPTSGARSFHQISVRDGGIGFNTKYLDRIFQVFQRLHGKSEYPGTGVGLAICQRVVENHGGGITASSSPGQGATFCIYLPV